MVLAKPLSMVLVSAVVAMPLGGCGGDDEPAATQTVTVVQTTAATPSPVPTAKADRALAREALLQLEDMPVGWTASADDSNAVDCRAFEQARVPPRAQTPSFEHGEERAAQAIVIYDTSDSADAAVDAFLSPATSACVEREVATTAQERDVDGAEFGEVTVARLNVEPLGQRSGALRVTIPISASGIDLDVYGDYVFSQVGRGLSMLFLGSSYSEPDDALRATLMRRAVDRLADTLEDD